MLKATQSLDLSHPLQARRWIRVWREDRVSGIRLKEDLRLDPSELGFSFAANGLGLRGTIRPTAPGVILGTSFAMGLAVNDGENWWELLKHSGDWFNLALPVGLNEMRRLVETYYLGEGDTLCFVYHPNLLQQCVMYERLAAANASPFKVFGWRTDLPGCLWLSARRLMRRWALVRKGEFMLVRRSNGLYLVDGRYCLMDLKRHSSTLARSAEVFGELLNRFKRVIILRARIKQDLAVRDLNPPRFDLLEKNYEAMWSAFASQINMHPNAKVLDTDHADWDWFHARDTHWNQKGNLEVALQISNAL